MPWLFWPAALGATALTVSSTVSGIVSGTGGSGQPIALPAQLMVVLMLAGGLPHGAFDLAIARRALHLGRSAALPLLAGYLGVAAAMFVAWQAAPLLALAAFLALSAVHFGEDWQMLEVGLLRIMAGASIVAVPAFCRTADVATLFTAMAGEQAEGLVRLAVAAAPVVVLVAMAGIAKAYLLGCRAWAAAQGAALVLLATSPPLVGFSLYFVFLHSPLHLRALAEDLPGWSRRRAWAYGGMICALTMGGGVALLPGLLSGVRLREASDAFRLLSIVAAPHLLLSHIVRRRAPEEELA